MLRTFLDTDFVGSKGPLFVLALKTSILTVLTLGIYRFWMKTRLRRYYWSSVRPGGVPLEYVGEPIEKLLGFLIAVVVMAFYLGIINLVLMFASFSIFQSNAVAYFASFAGVIPLWFFAIYRARRYVLARTRWRGIRFALDNGAWGYAFAALWHWFLTIITAGLLWPRKTFKLEKYITDRTWFGDHKLEQGGRWTMLFPAALPTIVAVILAFGSIGVMTVLPWALPDQSFGALAEQQITLFIVMGLGFFALPFCLIYYRVRSFELLTNHKTAGGLGFDFEPSAARVTRILFLGNFLAFFLVSLALTAVGLITVIGASGQDIDELAELGQIPFWLTTAIALISYFFLYVVWGVLRHVYVTQPLWRHYAETLKITGAPHLPSVSQRDRDEHREAEGFAEALDLGAAI